MAEQEDINPIYARWLAGELTPEELSQLKQEQDLSLLEKAMDEINTWTLPEVGTDRLTKVLEQGTSGAKVIPLYRKTAFWVAASVVLLLGSVFLFNPFAENRTEIATGPGEIQKIQLPDGSIAHINANSFLAYSANDWESNRFVEIKGDAYFEVVKGDKFKVSFPNGEIEVLGTRFEVKSTQEFFMVQCYEGKVRTTDLTSWTSEILTKGLGVRKVGTQALEPFENPKQLSPPWLEGAIRFYNNAPLVEVMYDLSTEYDIEFNHHIDLNRRFTGTFVTTNLDSALKMVFTPLGVTYGIEEKTVNLSTN